MVRPEAELVQAAKYHGPDRRPGANPDLVPV